MAHPLDGLFVFLLGIYLAITWLKIDPPLVAAHFLSLYLTSKKKIFWLT